MTDTHPEPRSAASTSSPETAGGTDTGSPASSLAFDLETIWNAVAGDTPATDRLVGARIADVTIVRMIAEGGMGRIYEGLQGIPRRTVAVKVQRPGRLDRASTQRFIRELGILGRLSHPWICRIHAAGVHEEGSLQFPYFVMEYLPGALPITLHAEADGLPLDRRIRLFRDVCEAVAVGHAQGVVHRDLKPGNILVAADGFPRVIDFGVAQACGTDDTATSLTGSGQLLGTLQYTAPELLGGGEAGPASDVWALGVILHELATGRLPFAVEGLPILAAIHRIGEHVPTLRRRARGRAGRAIATIVDACMAPSPGDRPEDAAALARRLTAALDGVAGDPGGWSRTTLLEHAPAHRSRALAVVGLVAGLVAVATIPLWRPAVPLPDRPDPGAARADEDRWIATPIPRPDFRHGFASIDDAEADRFLVESSGISAWHEPFSPWKSYWAPEAHDVEGRLLFRFDLPGTSRRIHLVAAISTWDDTVTKGVLGKGTAMIEASPDGETWTTLAGSLDPPQWGVGAVVEGLLPESCLGTATLWLRIRMLTTGIWANGSYNVAQFGNSELNHSTNVFQIDAECEPPANVATAGVP